MDRCEEAPLIHLHWALILSLAFMVLLGGPDRVPPLSHLLYVGVLLASGLVLPRLSVQNPRTLCVMLIGFDTGAALIGLAIGNSTSQDLMIAYFLCIVMASFGDSHERLAGVAMMLTGIYAFSRFQGLDVLHSSALLLHLPFLFAVTVFYGYVMQRFRGEVQYRRLFDTNPRPMWVYDARSLAFLEVNDAAVRQYGYSRGEFLGKTLKDIRPVEEVPALLSAVSSADSVLTTSGDFRHCRKDGSTLDVEVTSTAMLFNGRRARLVTATDITERKRAATDLQESLSLLRSIIESTADGLLVVNGRGKIAAFNQRFAQMWNIPDSILALRDDERAIAHVLDQLEHPERFLAKVRELYAQPDAESFDVLEFRDGRIFERYSQPQRIEGRSVGRVWSFREATDRRRAEAALQVAFKKAEESDRLKTAFLGSMSHEIRTPLNVILGYNELIRESLHQDGDGANASLLDAVRRASERLTHTIHGILDLAQLQSGSFEIRPASLELAKVIENELEQFRAAAASKGLSLSCQIDEPRAVVHCDEYCFVEALRHLLDNAIKFTAQGKVSVRLFRGQGGRISLEVHDTGIGMSESYLSRLFQPFSQEQVGNSRPFEGAGVGLAVAKGLLELNGAQMSVESLKGRGATFRICFNPKTERRQQRESSSAERSALSVVGGCLVKS